MLVDINIPVDLRGEPWRYHHGIYIGITPTFRLLEADPGVWFDPDPTHFNAPIRGLSHGLEDITETLYNMLKPLPEKYLIALQVGGGTGAPENDWVLGVDCNILDDTKPRGRTVGDEAASRAAFVYRFWQKR
jgi:hypothetical protein